MDKTEPKLIPAFQSEEEELAFWDTHDPEEYFEETPVSDVRLAVRAAEDGSDRPPKSSAKTTKRTPG